MIEKHSSAREGAAAGALAAAVVALWYFIIDMAQGLPMHTPNTIAQLLFGSGRSDAGEFGTIAVVTVVHFAVYMLVGVILTALAHLAIRDIAWRFGVMLAVVLAFLFFSGIAYMLEPLTGEHFPAWTVVGGGLLAVVTISGFLWVTHPELKRSFREVALGDETESAPYPPKQ
jgi:hypothetical protein